MEDAKLIEKRIKSVSETRKITNALYMIASTKLHQARVNLDKTNPSFNVLKTEIRKIARHIEVSSNKYFYDDDTNEDIEGTYGYLILTSDRGLAGSFNQNVIKEALRQISKHKDHKLFVVGEYGRNYFNAHNMEIDKSFFNSEENPTIDIAREIAGYIMEQYDSRALTKFYVIYTDFNSGKGAKINTDCLLPFHHNFGGHVDADEKINLSYEFFPSPEAVLNRIIPLYCIGYIYSALVDSYCSELNARMMAMDEANSNADNILHDLKIKHNHIRQGMITEEIIEISSSVNAMKHLNKK